MRKRIIEMDMARGLATLAVMTIHISAVPLIDQTGNGSIPFFSLLLNLAARFAVPTFILLSGMGLEMSYKPGEGYLLYLKRRMSKLIPAYVLWSVIYSLIYNDNTGMLAINHHIRPGSVVLALFTGNACYHLYFVPLIVQFYALFPLLRGMVKSKAGFVVCSLLSIALILADRYIKVPNALRFLLDYRDPLRWMVYFALGVWLAENCSRLTLNGRQLKSLVGGALLLCIVWMIAVVYPRAKVADDVDIAIGAATPILVIYAMVFIAWVWNQQWNNPFFTGALRKISKYSYGIYLSHALILAVCLAVYRSHNIQVCDVAFYACVMLTALPGSFALSWAVSFL